MKRVGLAGVAKRRVMSMIGLRRIVKGLIGCQLQDCPDEEIRAKQKELNTAYDAFYGGYGVINSSVNARASEDDSSYYLLCSLENVDEDGQLAGKADMFFKRTLPSPLVFRAAVRISLLLPIKSLPLILLCFPPFWISMFCFPSSIFMRRVCSKCF